MTFSDVKIGERFLCNGNVCVKKSARTAYLVAFARTFYFGQSERVSHA